MTELVKKPWLSHYGDTPEHIDYPKGGMAEAVEDTARQYPGYIAYEFLGGKTTYAAAVKSIRRCARAFQALGICEGQRVTVCLPNVPQAITVFYALNMIGAVANMVHPLSADKEIEFYLSDSESVAAVTLEQLYDKFKRVRRNVKLPTLILTSVRDGMAPLARPLYDLTEGRKQKKFVLEPNSDVLRWAEFLKLGDKREDAPVLRQANDPAVILYSGGTTGATKGILLSNLNFNALGRQIFATNSHAGPGDRMLAIMPVFHGFGLGVCIHSMLINGACSLLIPRFSPDTYANLLKKYRPNLIAGVPTLYETLLRATGTDKLELSSLKGVYSGGDTLTPELKKRFDKFLQEHNASVQIREGYGTTETVTACCLTPRHENREGSIGLPFPDTCFKIVEVGGERELPYGQEGEICISGPSVMLGYVNQPEETKNTLRTHADGLTWVHTGDLGVMDDDGYVYFRQRIKRMIITGGYNVYPSQVENVLEQHELVHLCCVIGVKHNWQTQRVKAFIVLKPGVKPDFAAKTAIMKHCREHLAQYALPYDIEFREQLPTTLVGKVAYRVLEAEEMAKQEKPEATDK